MWYFDSPLGVIRIYLDSSTRKYCLEILDDCIGQYPTADSAADDIAMFTTGLDEWDSLYGSFEPPIDLSEWSFFSK